MHRHHSTHLRDFFCQFYAGHSDPKRSLFNGTHHITEMWASSIEPMRDVHWIKPERNWVLFCSFLWNEADVNRQLKFPSLLRLVTTTTLQSFKLIIKIVKIILNCRVFHRALYIFSRNLSERKLMLTYTTHKKFLETGSIDFRIF